jgi:TonB family protein
MTKCLLKRVLPFTLTLLAGVLLWQVFAPRVQRFRDVLYLEMDGGGGQVYDHSRRGCKFRHKLIAETNPLHITHRPEAVYTSEAKRRGHTGVVRLRVTFGAGGAVTGVEPLNRQPYGLSESAEKAAWNIRFRPQMENGLPVSTTRVVAYDFPSEQTEDEDGGASPFVEW